MPTFKFNAVYKSLGDNLKYIADSEKVLPEADLLKVMSYVNGLHAETVYGRSYNCSLNPALAAEEFLSDREKYFACHKRKRLSGQGKGKSEILAHHVYVSCAADDPITPEILMKIADEFIEKMNLQEYRIFVAPHLNTKYKHFHMSISAYSMDGKKKFLMKNATRYRMEMELNYIAAKNGLSIIDDYKLRVWAGYNAPEYIAWLDAVKKEGKTVVRNNITIGEKILRAEERKERNADRNKKRKAKEKPTEKQIKLAVRENTYKDTYDPRKYYTAGGAFPNVRKSNKTYRIGLWTPEGRKRGTIELLFLLIAVAFVDTEKYAREKQYYRPRSEPAKEVQKMIDNIHRAKIYHITDLKDLKQKTAEVGSWLGSHKKAMHYIEGRMAEQYDEKLEERLQWHKAQYDLYRRQYRDLVLVRETIREVVRDQYRYNIYDFEPIEEIKKEPERKQSLNVLIGSAEKLRVPQTTVMKQKTIER